MKVKIIDQNGKGTWFLGRISLWDYLDSLNFDSFEYDIQRGIVRNQYLDTILSSIEKDQVLLPFSIVTRQSKIEDGYAIFQTFDILDGLQRTFRLWMYKKIADYAVSEGIDDFKSALLGVRKEIEVDPQLISISQVQNLFKKKSPINIWNLKDLYSSYNIYLYLWKGLSEPEVIKKMLILNAGQKRVSLAHQYELMYLRFFKSIGNDIEDNIKFLRFKSRDFKKVSRGDRNPGTYLMPTAIIALQSFISGKPVRLESNMVNVEEIDDEFIKESNLSLFFAEPFIKDFFRTLYTLDCHLCGDDMKKNKWFVKDTTISGILGGIGNIIREKYPEDSAFADNSIALFEMYATVLSNMANPFNIDSFYENYGKLSSVKVNIGSLVRKIIRDYTIELINNSNASWDYCFAKYNKD